MKDVEFIFEELARLFGDPCKHDDVKQYMKDRLWCRKFCGKVDSSKCWRKYFTLRELDRKNLW